MRSMGVVGGNSEFFKFYPINGVWVETGGSQNLIKFHILYAVNGGRRGNSEFFKFYPINGVWVETVGSQNLIKFHIYMRLMGVVGGLVPLQN